MRPAGFSGYSSDEYTDEDDLDYIGNIDKKKSNVKEPVKELTEKERYAILLGTLINEINKGNLEAAIKLIDANNLQIDVNLGEGLTPLLLAAANGYAEMCKVFIDRGANINQSKDTNTVLMHACNVSQYNPHFHEVIDIVKCLVDRKADVNILNKKRMSAFLCAASNGNSEVVQYLMDYCNKDAVDNQGWNALFFAVNDNHIDLVKFLLAKGMNTKKHDVRRNTVMDYARQRGFNVICDLLPDEEKKNKIYESYFCENYDYNVEVTKPRFMRDVNMMLVGMNCGPLLEKFSLSTMNLFNFLTLTKDDLDAMDIYKPYQQNRILGGLYRFHKHPYKFKSIPHLDKEKRLTTYDIGFSLISALRHYITIRAALRYLKLNAPEWDAEVLKQFDELDKRLQIAKMLTCKLQKKCSHWEERNIKVDLITYPQKSRKRCLFYAVPVITAVSIVLYFKLRL